MVALPREPLLHQSGKPSAEGGGVGNGLAVHDAGLVEQHVGGVLQIDADAVARLHVAEALSYRRIALVR